MKRFRHVVAKIFFLDKHWIEWGFGGRRGGYPPLAENGTKSPPGGPNLPISAPTHPRPHQHLQKYRVETVV
jgi:hypothetical protein